MTSRHHSRACAAVWLGLAVAVSGCSGSSSNPSPAVDAESDAPVADTVSDSEIVLGDAPLAGSDGAEVGAEDATVDVSADDAAGSDIGGVEDTASPGPDAVSSEVGGTDGDTSEPPDVVVAADTTPCTPGALGCECSIGQNCESGSFCLNGMCLCPPGEDSCPCIDSGCNMNYLLCDQNTDRCRYPRSCDEFGCGYPRLCTQFTVPVGLEGPPATDAICLDGCEAGFAWNSFSQTCDPELVPPKNCKSGAKGSILAECEGSLRTCVKTADGAECGECLPYTSDYDGKYLYCSPVDTCDDLYCEQELRPCIPETLHGDAVCGACYPGYKEFLGECQVANCDYPQPDYDVSILLQCLQANRECVEWQLGGILAHCGPCPDGMLPADPNDWTSLCSPKTTCSDLACAADEYCVEATDVANAHCAASPCPAGKAQNDFGECVTCTISCVDTGETGKPWIHTLAGSNECICETQTGYYFDLSLAITATLCDADGDGWVRAGAKSSVESDDAALRENARCGLRKIDRVALVNEVGQRRDVLSCQAPEGWIVAAQCTGPTAEVALYEPTILDSQADIDADDIRFPKYGTNRKFAANELNPFTKACVTAQADFNQNQVADVNESQGAGDAFARFAYFLELHRGHYEGPPVDGTFGAWVIEERRRWAPDFPIHYPASEGAYGKTCTRNRDAAWTTAAGPFKPVGFDFAQYACSASDTGVGTCPVPPPPVPANGTSVPAHGLDAKVPPADGVWRGMDHHSQFKCTVVAAGTNPSAPQEQPAGAFSSATTSSQYVFQSCQLGGTTPPAGSGAGSWSPDVQCTPKLTPLSVGVDVGFAAAEFTPGSTYVRGCINEWQPSAVIAEAKPWKSLCPGYDPNDPVQTLNPVGGYQSSNFGLIACCSKCSSGQYCAPKTATTFACTSCAPWCGANAAATGSACGAQLLDPCLQPCTQCKSANAVCFSDTSHCEMVLGKGCPDSDLIPLTLGKTASPAAKWLPKYVDSVPACNPAVVGPDVLYTFTATDAGNYRFIVDNANVAALPETAGMSLYSGACSSLACGDFNAGSGRHTIMAWLAAGETRRLAVHGQPTSVGAHTVHVQKVANGDLCETAFYTDAPPLYSAVAAEYFDDYYPPPGTTCKNVESLSSSYTYTGAYQANGGASADVALVINSATAPEPWSLYRVTMPNAKAILYAMNSTDGGAKYMCSYLDSKCIAYRDFKQDASPMYFKSPSTSGQRFILDGLAGSKITENYTIDAQPVWEGDHCLAPRPILLPAMLPGAGTQKTITGSTLTLDDANGGTHTPFDDFSVSNGLTCGTTKLSGLASTGTGKGKNDVVLRLNVTTKGTYMVTLLGNPITVGPTLMTVIGIGIGTAAQSTCSPIGDYVDSNKGCLLYHDYGVAPASGSLLPLDPLYTYMIIIDGGQTPGPFSLMFLRP